MFFDFLKYCLGNKVVDADFIDKMDWLSLFDFAKKQAILGFCFEGIERLGQEYPERLLKYQLDNFSGWGEYSVTCTVAAYNAGPQAVREYGGVPPYWETQNYVVTVNNYYRKLLELCNYY